MALEALQGDKTVQEIAAKQEVHPNQVSAWKRQALDGLSEVFSNGLDQERQDHEAEIRDFHAKISQLTVERDFVQGAQAMSREHRKAMITPSRCDLSLSWQCELVSISRSSFYYTLRGESGENPALIDELFLRYPFYGSRQMVRQLRREGIVIGRHRVRRLMRRMGLDAIYRAPRTSTPHPEHRVYPSLLRNVVVTRPDHVWCADISYIPVRRGFLYLVAIMDWASRHALAWRLSNTMDAGFCVEALQEALTRYGKPEIFNTDQGSQFTCLDSTCTLSDDGIAISMDGRGRYMDNARRIYAALSGHGRASIIERLWRSLKYEAVYLHKLRDGFEAERAIAEWTGFYNAERPHSSLNGATPAVFFAANRPVDMTLRLDKTGALLTFPQAAAAAKGFRIGTDSGSMISNWNTP